MLDAKIHSARRRKLRETLRGGAILWLGNSLQPRTYPANAYPFRQNSHFLYYVGLADPDIAVVSFLDDDRDVLFARPVTVDDIVWSGPLPSPEELAARAGIRETAPLATLGEALSGLRSRGATVHYLAPFQADAAGRMAALLGVPPSAVGAWESMALKRAVSDHRSRKAPEEVAEIEEALGVTAAMYGAAMSMARPGVLESEIAGRMQGIALASGRAQCFLPIVSVHGEVLHNEACGGILEPGRILLVDSGAESASGYASDITRAVPVDGRFTGRQRDIYDLVLAMQSGAIENARPGVSNLELHMGACRTLAAGLRDLGLVKGDPSLVVEAGAHALFFPHGLGHMLGLDVHDMEDLGDMVGYGEGIPRSTQFGLNFLRLARALEPGFVLTVEPGIYFIPALIDMWRAEGRHRDLIDYDRVETWRDFGGVRIEDDLLITATGGRVLGPHIPRTTEEVERATGVT